MWKLSRIEPDSDEFKAAFAEFVKDYGARGPNEWESRSPTWETEPELALVAIEQMRRTPDSGSPIEHQAARAAERERVGAEILAMLDGDAETQGQFAAALRARRPTPSGSHTRSGSRWSSSVVGTSNAASSTT
jgi:pyruvate,water dikinase